MTHRLSSLVFALGLLVLAGGSNPSLAETKTIVVSSTVVPRCKIEGVSDIRFGSLDPAQSINVSEQGWIAVACTRGVDYQVHIDKGLSYNAQAGLRQMRGGNGAYALPYSLTPEQAAGEGAGFANPTRINLRASIQGVTYRDLPADDYTDTLRVVLEY